MWIGMGMGVPVLELARVLAEGLLALLAHEDHLEALEQGVVFFLLVALGAVEPLLAAGRADGDLGVEDVFAHDGCMCCVVSTVYVGEVVVRARPWVSEWSLGCCRYFARRCAAPPARTI